MASAIASGVIRAGVVSDSDIYAYDVIDVKIDEFRESNDINKCSCIAELVGFCDMVVLSVKPNNYNDVLSEIAKTDISGVTFVSIAAGISTDRIKSVIGKEAMVVRVMPNTPILLGCGAAAACRCSNTGDEEFRAACSLFECSGELVVLDESKMNEVIAVSGSSPAFLFLFAKAVCEYAESVGISFDSAKLLFAQTMAGSAKMILNSGDDLQTLMDKVTSKGGTTAKALEHFYASGFEDIIKGAMQACTDRANELGKE